MVVREWRGGRLTLALERLLLLNTEVAEVETLEDLRGETAD